MEKKIDILVFGQLTDITGNGRIVLPWVSSSDALLEKIYESYPALRVKTFLLSVDQRIVRDNCPILTTSKIALLPPFSGG